MAPRESSAGGKERATLSRDFADLLIEFSIALHKHAMYPGGHPSLMPAAEGVARRLGIVFLDRASLSLGVAREQLVIEGVATDPRNPVLHELAGRLHRHHLGAITFRKGITGDELHGILDLIAVEADRSGQPLGLGPAERLTQWPHARLYPLTYERLHLIREGEDPDETPEQREGRTHAAQLWVGLARAALAAEAAGAAAADGIDEEEDEGDGDARPPAEPAVVARAIEKHERGTAYDQVIVGYLLQIADEVKRGGGADAVALQRRVSQLVRDLDGGTLSRLLEMGGDRGQRHQFLQSASDGLAVDAVIDLVRAASGTEKQTVSHSMLRMLQKLAQHATGGTQKRRAMADRSVRDQVAAMLRGWSLSDPNPGAYGEALQRMASTRVPDMTPAVGLQHTAEHHRILQMAVEIGARGPGLERAVNGLLQDGRLSTIAKTLGDGVEGGITADVWKMVASPEVMHQILASEPLEVEQLDLLIGKLGVDAAEPMLDALVTSQSTQARRLLLDRLVKFGSQISPMVVARLPDASWYVQRNMLAILAELPEGQADFEWRAFVEHTDARVRREAFRVLLRDPGMRERAIHYALRDTDQRSVRLGLAAAMEMGCPDSVVPRAGALASAGVSEDLRVMAIRVLGTSRNPAAADALLPFVTPQRRSLIFRARTGRTPEQRAALTALRSFAHLPRVRDVLDRTPED